MLIAALAVMAGAAAANKYDNTDTIVVARDGTGEFRTIGEAVEVCRAFMDYTKVIYVKRGLYKEKLTVPQWLTNIEIVGEDRDETIITYDDHANIRMPETGRPMGTFRTFTVRVQGSGITFKNITIENNAAQIGQAVALHTEGDRLTFVNCRLLGNQDTIYTGNGGTRLFFKDCLIEGTTDFIFGPSTAWFENCDIHSRRNSYITAASTPKGCEVRLRVQPLPADRQRGCQQGIPWPPLARLWLHAVHELRDGRTHSPRRLAPLGEAARANRPLP